MSTIADTHTVNARFQLAKAWGRSGNLARAEVGFREVLALDPAHVPARLQLGHTLLKLGQVDEALDCYVQVLSLAPDDTEARIRHDFIKAELTGGAVTAQVPRPRFESHADGKLNLDFTLAGKTQRSVWALALEPLHNAQGILFDGWIEDNFARRHWQPGIRDAAILDELRELGLMRQLATSEEQGLVPYTRPWVGFVHNPPNMPEWFHSHEMPQTIFAKEIWKTSLESCVGLFTFSEYEGAWLRRATGQLVSVLTHPTEIPELEFDFERFLANPHKKIIQVGWWLRHVSAIYRLPLARHNPLGYEKIRLVPHFFDGADAYLNNLVARELAQQPDTLEPRYSENTRAMQHLSNERYDELLSENIAMALLYDANANNLVVECIARATPLLINPLPAVVEYLGPDYPLYIEDLDDAAEKALDLDLLLRAHEYLKALDTRRKLRADYFLSDFCASAVYQAIPGN